MAQVEQFNRNRALAALAGLGLIGYGLYRWRSTGLDRRVAAVGILGLASLAWSGGAQQRTGEQIKPEPPSRPDIEPAPEEGPDGRIYLDVVEELEREVNQIRSELKEVKRKTWEAIQRASTTINKEIGSDQRRHYLCRLMTEQTDWHYVDSPLELMSKEDWKAINREILSEIKDYKAALQSVKRAHLQHMAYQADLDLEAAFDGISVEVDTFLRWVVLTRGILEVELVKILKSQPDKAKVKGRLQHLSSQGRRDVLSGFYNNDHHIDLIGEWGYAPEMASECYLFALIQSLGWTKESRRNFTQAEIDALEITPESLGKAIQEMEAMLPFNKTIECTVGQIKVDQQHLIDI